MGVAGARVLLGPEQVGLVGEGREEEVEEVGPREVEDVQQHAAQPQTELARPHRRRDAADEALALGAGRRARRARSRRAAADRRHGHRPMADQLPPDLDQ